jgi:hypothetical protein
VTTTLSVEQVVHPSDGHPTDDAVVAHSLHDAAMASGIKNRPHLPADHAGADPALATTQHYDPAPFHDAREFDLEELTVGDTQLYPEDEDIVIFYDMPVDCDGTNGDEELPGDAVTHAALSALGSGHLGTLTEHMNNEFPRGLDGTQSDNKDEVPCDFFSNDVFWTGVPADQAEPLSPASATVPWSGTAAPPHLACALCTARPLPDDWPSPGGPDPFASQPQPYIFYDLGPHYAEPLDTANDFTWEQHFARATPPLEGVSDHEHEHLGQHTDSHHRTPEPNHGIEHHRVPPSPRRPSEAAWAIRQQAWRTTNASLKRGTDGDDSDISRRGLPDGSVRCGVQL